MNLRAERIRMGLTLPAFAKETGVPYKTVLRAERGNPVREDSAKLIADFLGCDPIVFVEPEEARTA